MLRLSSSPTLVPSATPAPEAPIFSGADTAMLSVGRVLPWRKRVGMFLGMLVVFLLAGSREVPWSDAKYVHGVAQAIAEKGTVALPNGIPYAGKYYGMHPLLPSLVHVPGAYLHHKIATTWPTARARSLAFTSHLGSAVVAALAVVLFVQLCLDLGLSLGVAGFGGLVLGLGTMVAIYARVAWSEIVQVCCFIGFYRCLLRVADTPSRAAAIAVGVWGGLLVNSKLVYLTCLPGAALFAGLKIGRLHGLRTVARGMGWALLGALPGMVMLFGYSLVRTGSILGTGYGVGSGGEGPPRAFSESLLYGLHGLFFSTGKGVFLYNPPLIIGALSLPLALRIVGRTWLWAALLTAVPPVLVHARLVFWSGDWSWGPRYLLFLVPLLLLPAVVALEKARATGHARAASVVAGVTLAVGLGVQVVGGMFYWDNFIRLAQDAQHHWLGKPNRAGAVSAVRPNDGRCDPCFEDFYTFNHLPAFQPIEGHLWLAHHKLRDHTYARALVDAPWRRYTALPLPLQRHYDGARFDWWALDYKKGKRPRRTAWAIGVGGLLLMGLAVWLWAGSRDRHQASGLRY